MGTGVQRGCETSVLKVFYDPKGQSTDQLVGACLKQEDALSDSLPTRRVVGGESRSRERGFCG